MLYSCSPDIRWVKDGDQILLVHLAGSTHGLRGAEATLWEYLALGHQRERVVRLLAVLRNCSLEETYLWLALTLATWQQDGILTIGAEAEHDESGHH